MPNRVVLAAAAATAVLPYSAASAQQARAFDPRILPQSLLRTTLAEALLA
jgi:hypothetical protein